MKKFRFAIILLALTLICSSAVPAYASEVPESDPLSAKAARYSVIADWDCSLRASSNEASVSASVQFTEGIRCFLTVRLYQDGEEIRTWATSSTTGNVRIRENISNLPAGTYEAVMEFSAGPDEGSESSGEQEIS